MELRMLKYFLAVSQEENVTKAAELVHTSQPNISRQIAELEKEIGIKLFERVNRRLTLTEEGMFFRKRAKEIIDLVEKTESDLNTLSEVTGGEIHIGAAETHAMKLIAKAIYSLRLQYKQIRFNIFSGSTIEVTEQLNKGLLDFGILVEPVDLTKYDYLKLPVKDTFGLLMRKDNSLAELQYIRAEDIKNQPVFVARQQLDSNIFSGWLGYDIRKLNIVSTFNLITTPAMMVEAGLGSAFTFDKLVNTDGSELCFRPLEPKVETGLYLVWKKYQIFTKASKLFLDEIQDKFIK